MANVFEILILYFLPSIVMSTETRKNDCAPVFGPYGTPVSSSCDTTIEIYEVTHVWVIRHYSFLAKKLNCNYFSSRSFTATGDENCRWTLIFYPDGCEENETDISVFLMLHHESKYKTAYAKFKI